ncbi:MAG TPA: FHA domain-containing protein, partial [Anaeromyxobacteraceae bacterium]|nr:FHA domain-containing protein [Anaeromyxobacteraceae bacterium]
MSRLTGIVGSVCRRCDTFNEPGLPTCLSCGEPLPRRPAPVLAAGVPAPPPPVPPEEAARELPPIDFEAVLVEDPDFEPTATPHPIALLDAVVEAPEPGRPAAPSLPFESVALEPSAAGVAGPRFRLVLERGDGREGAGIPLEGDEVVVGGPQATLPFPDDPWMAPLHATFCRRDGKLFLRDEGSAGGTFLRLRGLSVPLRPGDAFAIGDRLLRYGGLLQPPAPPAPDGTRRAGSPRPTGPTVLVEERLAGGATGRVWLRSGPSVPFGRAGCAVNLGDDPFVSQAHAELVLDGDGGARLRDLGSANGTFVRLPPRAERELRDGDRVRIGRQVLRVAE